MNLSNPLPATWQAVSVGVDALKITRRVLARSPVHPNTDCQQALQIFQHGLFFDTVYGRKADSLSLLGTMELPSQEVVEVESLLVLGLWATFERFLRNYLQEKGTVLKQHLQPTPFADCLYDHFAKNVEKWEPREILAFLKASLFTTEERQQLIADANGILTYRNSVAHANPKKGFSRFKVEDTYNILNGIINILLQY
jgi:hypothetical protein